MLPVSWKVLDINLSLDLKYVVKSIRVPLEESWLSKVPTERKLSYMKTPPPTWPLSRVRG